MILTTYHAARENIQKVTSIKYIDTTVKILIENIPFLAMNLNLAVSQGLVFRLGL